jgi:hypothetical protein
MEIKINNGSKLLIEVDESQRRLRFKKVNSKNEIERIDSICESDIVLLYDYIVLKRDNNEELL